jgi:hypothetical protein
MNVRRLLCLLALCAAPSGCSFLPYAIHNLVEAPCDVIDRGCLRRRFHQQAREAWKELTRSDPSHAYSRSYACGFEEGFVEFLDGDGTGEPPAAPPWGYRTPRYLTPEGRQEVDDWFAGFRHGAAVARASGLRETVVVPLALPPIHTTLGSPEMPRLPPPAPEPSGELPSPRILPVPDDNPDAGANQQS